MILSLFNSFCSGVGLSSIIATCGKYVIDSYTGWSDEDFIIEWWSTLLSVDHQLMGVLRKEFPVIWIKSLKMHLTKFYTICFSKWQPHYSFKELFFFFFFFFTDITALKYFKKDQRQCTWGLSAKPAPSKKNERTKFNYITLDVVS